MTTARRDGRPRTAPAPAAALVLLGLSITGCDAAAAASGTRYGTDAAGQYRMLRWRAATGAPHATRRIDGEVVDAFPARLWNDDLVTLAVTGPAPGSDQHRILVFDRDGVRAAEWRPPADNPWGFRQTQYPVSGSVQIAPGGRRDHILAHTAGLWYPSALVLLEATAARRLEERLVVWNPGVILRSAAGADRIAFVAVNNRMQAEGGVARSRGQNADYPLAVGIVDFPPVPAGGAGDRVVVESPTAPDRPGRGYRAYYLLPLADRMGEGQAPVISVGEDGVEVSMATGLSFTVDTATGAFRFGATAAYLPHRAGRAVDAPADVAAHLEELRAGVVAWPARRK